MSSTGLHVSETTDVCEITFVHTTSLLVSTDLIKAESADPVGTIEPVSGSSSLLVYRLIDAGD